MKTPELRAVRCIGLLVFLMLWQLGSSISPSIAVLFPGPKEVMSSAATGILEERFQVAIVQSLIHYSCGSTIGILVGILIGFLQSESQYVRAALSIPFSILRPVPPLAWIPLAVLWLGINHGAACFIIALGVFWPAFDGSAVGFGSVDRRYLELARCYGREDLSDRYLNIILPAALPVLISSIRSALGFGWMLLVAAELTGVPGVGSYMWEASGLMATDKVVLCMLTISFAHFFVERVMRSVEAKIAWWES